MRVRRKGEIAKIFSKPMLNNKTGGVESTSAMYSAKIQRMISEKHSRQENYGGSMGSE